MMISQKTLFVMLAGILSLLCLPIACLRVERSYPEKRTFILDVSRHGTLSSQNSHGILRVVKFRLSPQFESKGFVYCTGDGTYESDFYNEFFTSPGSMIGQVAAKWLSGSGLFGHVTDSVSYVDADYVLEGTVTALYGDYSQSPLSRAVLEIQFLLIRDIPPRPEILLKRQYHEESPLEANSPEALVKGWNQALQRILTRFENDLLNSVYPGRLTN
jgi:cholesterol transport system auxiliary component